MWQLRNGFQPLSKCTVEPIRCHAGLAPRPQFIVLIRVPREADSETNMKRREFLTLLGGAATVVPQAAVAQTSSKTYRLGTLTPGPPRDEKSPDGAILVRVLAQHGYTSGET